MSVIKFNRDFSTLFNWDSDESPTTEQEYQNAVKNWTETEMNIVDTLLWQPETDYTEENVVKTPSLPLHYVLVCTTGGTSGTEEPSYDNVQIGDSVTDGTITWTVAKLTVSSDVPTVTDRALVDASNIGVNAEEDNSELWGNAIGGGAVAEDDGKLVTGDTVYAVTNGLASDIADNTDDIATNTENISQNATDIDIADKRISNIEKLLQGNLYDYQTDSNSAYTKTVPAGAMPYASLDSIGGKTIVWNQLYHDTRTGTSKGVSLNVVAGYVKFSGTSSSTGNGVAFCDSSFKIPNGHKVLWQRDFELIGNDIIIDQYNTNTTFDICTRIYSIYQNPGYAIAQIRFADVGHDYTGVEGHLMCFDLTLLYGAGNEPTTVAEFQQTFPAVWYAYNKGQLLSAGVTSVISKKADTTEIATYPIPAEVQALEGYGWSTRTIYNYIDFERKVFVQRLASVNLGSMSWTYQSGYFRGTQVTGAKTTAYGICAFGYTVSVQTITTFITSDPDKTILINPVAWSTPYVCIKDSSYTDADTFKTAMSGQYLYYELATPVEIDISAYLTDDNLIEVEAGGTLTFENQNGDDYRIPVPSAETYMVDLQSAI